MWCCLNLLLSFVGAFGVVYHGKLVECAGLEGKKDVAIKTIKRKKYELGIDTPIICYMLKLK